MKKIIVYILIVAVILMPATAYMADEGLARGSKGDEVYVLQNRLRELGYVSFRPTGNFSSLTYNAVVLFQQNNGLSVDGIVGSNGWDALFKVNTRRVRQNTKIPRIHGPGNVKQYKDYGFTSRWTRLSELFPVGETIKIIDFNTSISFNVTRVGGVNHADVEVATAEDKEKFLECFKDYTWEKRAMLAEINGNLYAASLFGMPNNNDVIEGNEMDGSLCLYFNGSTSDIGSISDAEHQNNIVIASGQAR